MTNDGYARALRILAGACLRHGHSVGWVAHRLYDDRQQDVIPDVARLLEDNQKDVTK